MDGWILCHFTFSLFILVTFWGVLRLDFCCFKCASVTHRMIKHEINNAELHFLFSIKKAVMRIDFKWLWGVIYLSTVTLKVLMWAFCCHVYTLIRRVSFHRQVTTRCYNHDGPVPGLEMSQSLHGNIVSENQIFSNCFTQLLQSADKSV